MKFGDHVIAKRKLLGETTTIGVHSVPEGSRGIIVLVKPRRSWVEGAYNYLDIKWRDGRITDSILSGWVRKLSPLELLAECAE